MGNERSLRSRQAAHSTELAAQTSRAQGMLTFQSRIWAGFLILRRGEAQDTIFCGACCCVGCPNTAHFWFPEPTKVVQAAEGSSLTLSRGQACGRWVWGASFQGWLTHRTPFPRFCGAFIKLFDELLRHPLKACRMSCPLPEPLLGYAHGSEWEPRHLDPSRLAHASRSVVTGKIPDLHWYDP